MGIVLEGQELQDEGRERKVAAITTVTSKGQITLPKGVRKALGLRPGDRLLITVHGDYVLIVPLRRHALADLYRSLPVNEPLPDMHVLRDQRHRESAQRILEDE